MKPSVQCAGRLLAPCEPCSCLVQPPIRPPAPTRLAVRQSCRCLGSPVKCAPCCPCKQSGGGRRRTHRGGVARLRQPAEHVALDGLGLLGPPRALRQLVLLQLLDKVHIRAAGGRAREAAGECWRQAAQGWGEKRLGIEC